MAATTESPNPDMVRSSIEKAHHELWSRFVLQQEDYAIVLDYAGLDGSISLPTPEECAAGKPNALAWWCPAENGAFFNGLYIDGLINRWKQTRDERDRDRVHRIARGLIKLAEVGNTPGFIARGVASDGQGHHFIGSDDQSIPWYYGLWKYINSGLCASEDRERIIRLMSTGAEAIRRLGWRMPCDQAGYAFRGSWEEPSFRDAARVLFMLKILSVLTGDPKWSELYCQVGEEKAEGSDKTRFEWCGTGIQDDEDAVYECELLTKEVCERAEFPVVPKRRYPYWISASSQSCQKELSLLEENEAIRLMYQQGLAANAKRALNYITTDKYTTYDNDNQVAFNTDWRLLNEHWKPQASVEDALQLAATQYQHWRRISPRKVYEDLFMREPLFAAWFIMLSGDQTLIEAAREPIGRLLTQYEWNKLHYSYFYITTCVYYSQSS